jgi:hypothetical protein
MRISPSAAFLQFLDFYGIKYKSSAYESINIDKQDEIFNDMIWNNDIAWLEKIAYDIDKCFYSRDMIAFPTYGSLEMNMLFLEKCGTITRDTALLRITASRYDDNLEIFKLYATKINFPADYYSLYEYEYCQSRSTVYDILIIAIEHDNYNIFHYVATTNGLSKNYPKIKSNIKNILWKLKNPNFKIIYSLLFEFEFDINYDDLVTLLNNNQRTTLEYIIDLIQSRKIVISENLLKSAIRIAQDNSLKELFDCLI